MEKIKSRLSKLRGGWLALIGVVISLVFGGQSVKLTCNRLPNTSITCTKQSNLFGVIPLGAKIITDVQGAKLDEAYDQESATVYRVELISGRGYIPLSTIYSPYSAIKADVMDQINAFVTNMKQSSLTVHEPGLLSMENAICMITWIPVALALSFIWNRIKSGLN